MLDAIEAEPRSPQQDLAAMSEPFRERLGKTDHLGNAPLYEHVHVERNAALELGELEQRFHQQGRVDGPGAGLDYEPNVLGRFVPRVGDQRQFSLVDELGDALDQPPLLDQPRDLSDYDEVGPPAGILRVPARTHTKRPAAR